MMKLVIAAIESVVIALFLLCFLLSTSGCGDDPASSDQSDTTGTVGENHSPNYPSNPYPDHLGISEEATTVTLTWSCDDPDGDELTYNLSFGATQYFPIVAEDLTEASYTVSDLEPSTQYYWAVSADDENGGHTMGPTWSFTTAESGGGGGNGGDLIWNYFYGSSGNDNAGSLVACGDGGYLMVGDWGWPSNQLCAIKVDADGIEQWREYFDGDFNIGQGNGYGANAIECSGGGYVITYGSTSSDIALTKLDIAGSEVWTSVFPGPSLGSDYGIDVIEKTTGGFVVAGFSNGGDGIDYEMTLMYVNPSGEQEWVRYFNDDTDPSLEEYGTAVVEAEDGNLFLLGKSGSSDNKDILIIKTDTSGNELWRSVIDLAPPLQSYMTTDAPFDACLTPGGGLMVTGLATVDGEGQHLLVLNVDNEGNFGWDYLFGDDTIGYDYGNAIIPSVDGNYLVCGRVEQESYTGGDNIYLGKFSEAGDVIWEHVIEESYIQLGRDVVECSDGSLVILSMSTNSEGNGGYDFNLRKISAID